MFNEIGFNMNLIEQPSFIMMHQLQQFLSEEQYLNQRCIQQTMVGMCLNTMQNFQSVTMTQSEPVSRKISMEDIKRKQSDPLDFQEKYKTEVGANILYKKVCKYWVENGSCQYGDNCAFAHGFDEIRQKINLPSKYKTKQCKNFYQKGYCPYGHRCQFQHSSFQIKTSTMHYQNLISKFKDFWNFDLLKFNLNVLPFQKKRLQTFQSFKQI